MHIALRNNVQARPEPLRDDDHVVTVPLPRSHDDVALWPPCDDNARTFPPPPVLASYLFTGPPCDDDHVGPELQPNNDYAHTVPCATTTGTPDPEILCDDDDAGTQPTLSLSHTGSLHSVACREGPFAVSSTELVGSVVQGDVWTSASERYIIILENGNGGNRGASGRRRG